MQKQDEHAQTNNADTRQLFKSMVRFSWAQSLFGLRQFGGLLAPGQGTCGFDNVIRSTETELSEPVRNFFRVGDRIQRETVDILCGAAAVQSRHRNGSQTSGGPGSVPH